MLQTTFLEKIKTHILCSITYFPENHALYEIIWKSILKRYRPQMTIWRMRVACWITSTHSEYVIVTLFPLQQWLRERSSMLRYMYIACLDMVIMLIRNINWTSLTHICEENISGRREGFKLTIVEPFTCLTSLLIYTIVIQSTSNIYWLHLLELFLRSWHLLIYSINSLHIMEPKLTLP